MLDEALELVFDGLELDGQAIVGAHPEIDAAEVVGDDVRLGEIDQVVVAFGEVVGEGVGAADEVELGGFDQVLLQALPHAQVVGEQGHRVEDEDPDGDEALPVTP